MSEYISALMTCLEPINLLLIVAMVSLGIVFGAIPRTFCNAGYCPAASCYLWPFYGNLICAAAGNLDWRCIRNLYFCSADWYSRFFFCNCYLL